MSSQTQRRRTRPQLDSAASVEIALGLRDQATDTAQATQGLRQQDRQLEDDAQRDVVDNTSFTAGTSTGRAPSPEAQPATIANFGDVSAALAKSFLNASHINMSLHRYKRNSWYYPSSLVLFEVLYAMDTLLIKNEEVMWKCPHYFSLPVRVYCSVMFYMQTMRARDQIGALTDAEGTWLRNFLRKFKDTSLPIAGPLIGYFMNLNACLPDNDQCSFVTPEISTTGTYSTTVTGTPYHDRHVDSGQEQDKTKPVVPGYGCCPTQYTR